MGLHLSNIMSIALVSTLVLAGCAQSGQFSEEAPAGFINPNTPDAINQSPTADSSEQSNSSNNTKASILQKYNYLDPKRLVPTKILEQAVLYFDKNKSKIKNQNYITAIDMRQHSSKKRLYLINMKSGEVTQTWAAHGSGSDSNNDGLATQFSNEASSKMSSLGFYLTGGTYIGKHGTSLYLHGLDKTNSNAYSRSVVMHGADYVNANYVKSYGRIGRSWGCPAIDQALVKTLIPLLQGGSVLYIYYNQ